MLERPVQQLLEALDEGAVVPAVEIVDKALALALAFRAAGREQAVEIAGARGRQSVEVELRLLLEDVEVAHRAQRASRAAQAFEDGAHRLAVKILVEDPQGHAHAPRGDAHDVQLLRILAETRAGLVLEHARLHAAHAHGPAGLRRVS